MFTNPFDPQTILFAKHAQHIVLIHFPIALFLAGVFFDFLGHGTKNAALVTVAYFNFLFAAVSTVPVVATGLLAWQWALEGQKLKGILLLHLVLGCFSSVLIWTVWLLHRAGRRKSEMGLPGYRAFLEVSGAVVIAMTAHLGGFLSGVLSA